MGLIRIVQTLFSIIKFEFYPCFALKVLLGQVVDPTVPYWSFKDNGFAEVVLRGNQFIRAFMEFPFLTNWSLVVVLVWLRV